jgi:hypothetical protein
VSYEPLPTAGQKLSLAGVKYYAEGTLELMRPIDGYCAVCLGANFYPVGRDSAEYIVVVDPAARREIGTSDGMQFSGPRVW